MPFKLIIHVERGAQHTHTASPRPHKNNICKKQTTNCPHTTLGAHLFIQVHTQRAHQQQCAKIGVRSVRSGHRTRLACRHLAQPSPSKV